MRKGICTFVIIALAAATHAQSFTARVLILNEGYFDYLTNTIITPVTVGAYDPTTGVYTTVNTIDDARFASDIKMDGAFYYVAADHSLLKYETATDALVDEAEVAGIRKIAITEDQIIVTRGEYLVDLPSYVQIYNKSDLSLAYEISAAVLPHTTEGVAVAGDKAYIAVNNGFVFGAEVGYIAELDLSAEAITSTVDLGASGVNPDNLMQEGEFIYTLNNKDFTGSSVSAYRISTGELSTTDLVNISSGCGTSALQSGTIYYQEMFGTTLSRFDAASATITGENDFGLSFYGLAFDPASGLMYVSETDYFSFGKVYVYNTDNSLVTSFDAGVSPGNFAFDVRTASAVENPAAPELQLAPNPVISVVQVTAPFKASFAEITDISGKLMLYEMIPAQEQVSLDVRGLASGTYIVRLRGAEGNVAALFQKQ